ncbi:uncharacterized protein B0I36DRAFT_357536 [Microdochium trichocladiopsis]|uniref:Only prolin and serin are matching in the corresponding protein n=1 Tax=Microdochium trichocladiopsis TaxID=1682393 RepID=A0A9P9BVF1_9PEZI|nr:uncharacterized protein B0I36DRAFT_357536 [Microdochium trichocladiopsis]KAH7040198.1 hypothetical protein B0I36DRAFT_357536 [Microdochium trichocladiopsis]
MSSMLRPLRLPQLVEERKKRESMQTEQDVEPTLSFYTFSSTSSELTSPVTPTFSARSHMRHSSSASSFDLAIPSTPEYPPSPTRAADISAKWSLTDVQEEPSSYEYADAEDYVDFDDASSDQFDLTDCLRDEPRYCQAPNLQVVTGFDLYDGYDDFDYNFGLQHESDAYREDTRSSRKLSRRFEAPFASLSTRLGSRLPSLKSRRSLKQCSAPGSPIAEGSLERYSRLSRGVPSPSSSRSTFGTFHYDRSNEPPLPPTPDLSRYGSSDSVAKRVSSVLEEVEEVRDTIQRDRAMATTPLLPPFMNGIAAPPSTAMNSPLVSPTVAFATISMPSAPQSPLVSPPLSSKPSLTSFPSIMASTELPLMPEPDAWSDLLGHANFTITPAPYQPQGQDSDTLQKFQEDWETARVNYTKHLARTGEHYGDTSKTYSLTQAKWSEIENMWSSYHKQIIADLIACGASLRGQMSPEEVVPTTLPHMAEGKFPERGDQDIVGPMVRQATMSPMADTFKRPSLWKRLTGR